MRKCIDNRLWASFEINWKTQTSRLISLYGRKTEVMFSHQLIKNLYYNCLVWKQRIEDGNL